MKREAWRRKKLTPRQAEVTRAVIRNNGNKAAAARELGIARATVVDVLEHPGAMAVLSRAMTMKGLTALTVAEDIRVLLRESERPVVVGDGKGLSHVEMVADNQTRVAAARLVTDVWDRASKRAEREQERAARPDVEQLAAMTDEELLTALSRTGQRAPAPIEATARPSQPADQTAEE